MTVNLPNAVRSLRITGILAIGQYGLAYNRDQTEVYLAGPELH